MPSKEFRDFQAFQRREVAKLAKEMVDITHACGCEAMMFLGDHWIGTEPFMPEFKTIGLVVIVALIDDVLRAGGGLQVDRKSSLWKENIEVSIVGSILMPSTSMLSFSQERRIN